MRKVEIITAEQAAQLVKDNDTITSIGFVSSAHPEALTKALEKTVPGHEHPAELDLHLCRLSGQTRWPCR